MQNEGFVKVRGFWKWVHGETGFGGLEEGEVVGLGSNRKRFLCLFFRFEFQTSSDSFTYRKNGMSQFSVSEFSLVGDVLCLLRE